MTITRNALDQVPFRTAVASDIDDGDAVGGPSDAYVDLNDLYGRTRAVVWSWPRRSGGIDLPSGTASFTTFATATVRIAAEHADCTVYVRASGTVASSTLRISGTLGGPDDIALTSGTASGSVQFIEGVQELTLSVQNNGANDITVDRVMIVADVV